MLLGDPYNGVVNAGHLFVRNTQWSDTFLERVYGRVEYLDHPWREDAALIALDREDPDVRRHAAVVPNKLFNAYPDPDGGYATGDFVVHFPGRRRPGLDGMMQSYGAMVR